MYSSTLSLPSTLDGVDRQRHAPASLPLGNSGVPRNFFRGVQQIQLTEGRENRYLGTVAP
jgi:hypothetical protein